MIRVGIVDDQQLVRLGFQMLLDAEADIDIVGEATDGASAIALAKNAAPDVLLMDVRMPGMDGIEATAAITALGERPRILVLTTFDLDEYAFDAMRAGASGFLLKDATPGELLSAIRQVHAGDGVLAPRVTKRMMEHFAAVDPATKPPCPVLATLTPRETETLIAIGQGMTNDEIATSFFVAESTVKTHVSRLLQKLSARDRVQLVILAYEQGLVG